MSLQIGVARADITPPVGIPMVGFAGRDESDDVHDPLTATALVATQGEVSAALVCLDLLFLAGETADAMRAAIAAATGIPAGYVALCSAHNHYGPSVDRGESPLVEAYRAHLGHVLVGLVGRAQRQRRSARLGVGWGDSDIGVNRRERRPDGQIVLGENPAGPVDRQVGVLRIDQEDGAPLATVVSFACHPVCQHAQIRALSADYPGRMRQVVETLTGAPCLFLQGAAGNINPIRMEHAYEPARSLGTRLGSEAVRVWETIKPGHVSGLRVAAGTVCLPRYRYGSPEAAAALVGQLEQELAGLDAQGNESASRRWWTHHRLERARQVVESWTTGAALPGVEAELQAWRLGGVGMATAPGEIFTEIGQRVKAASPFADTFFAGYTNGSIGYVPVRKAYLEGGYEVTHACQVDPEAGEIVEAECLKLLRTLA
ncbi:MAG: hypothetical protein AB1505_27070 [Candidatus Latescibacterota bacterium]